MHNALDAARQELACNLSSFSEMSLEPVSADAWVANSLMQKSARRSETETAQRAALRFLTEKGPAIWRRLMIIAFEDIGVGSVDTVVATVAACSDPAWRRGHGGDALVAMTLAAMLADAPKDRTADHLAQAKDHPSLSPFAETMSGTSTSDLVESVRNEALTLPQRAVGAFFACGDQYNARSKHGVEALLTCYRDMGVPDGLLSATFTAVVRTREPFTLMMPLIWLAEQKSAERVVRECPLPPTALVGDVPLYALDEHTRLGRQAIWRFAHENDQVQMCLERFVPAARFPSRDLGGVTKTGRIRRLLRYRCFRYIPSFPAFFADRRSDQSAGLHRFARPSASAHNGTSGQAPAFASLSRCAGDYDFLCRAITAIYANRC